MADYDKERINKSDYYVHWKSAQSNGMTDKVAMKITAETPDSIRTRLTVESSTGGLLNYNFNAQDSTWEVIVNGQPHENEDRITAYYTQDDGTKIAVGHLNLVSYNKQDMKLVIVPVNKAYNLQAHALKELLDNIYKGAITFWDVSVASQPISVDFEKNNTPGLDTKLPAFRAYTREMEKVIAELKDQSYYDRKAYYLFLVDKSEDGIKSGIMPFKRHFGFIFMENGSGTLSAAEVHHTMAHELGHGPFGLEHPWEEKSTTQGATHNLMDYTDKKPDNLLRKYQWYYIHNPKSSWFGGSEEEVSDASSNFVVIEGSIPSIHYKNRNNSISGLGYIDIKNPSLTFITPAGYPIKIENVKKVKFSINGGVLNFITDKKHYFGITQGDEFRGYISKEIKDKLFPTYTEGTKETTFKISKKVFTQEDEELFKKNKLGIGDVIKDAIEDDDILSFIKIEVAHTAYLDCILKVKWKNRLTNNSGAYTGYSPPFTIQQDAEVIYINGNQCEPKYENNNLDDGVGKTIFYFELVKLISTQEEVDKLTEFCNFLSACSTYPFYFADKEDTDNYTETASSTLCKYLYKNKIVSLIQFNDKFKKYEARGKPFYSTENLAKDIDPKYNEFSIDFTTLNLETHIQKLENNQLSFSQYFSIVFEQMLKTLDDEGLVKKENRYVYSFKDLVVRYGILNYLKPAWGYDQNVIKTYLQNIENDHTARAVCDDEEKIQYKHQFGTYSAYFASAPYVEEMQIASEAALGNFMFVQKFQYRRNYFSGRSGVKNGYRRFIIVTEADFNRRLEKLGLNDLKKRLESNNIDKKKFWNQFKNTKDEVLIAFNKNGAKLFDVWKSLRGYPDLQKDMRVYKFIGEPNPPKGIAAGARYLHDDVGQNIEKINDNYQIAKAKGKLKQFFSGKPDLKIEKIEIRYHDLTTTVEPSLTLLQKMKAKGKFEFRIENKKITLTYEDLGLGYSAIISPDGRMAFVLTGNVGIIMKKYGLTKNRKFTRVFAEKVKEVANHEGIKGFENVGAILERQSSHAVIEKQVFGIEQTDYVNKIKKENKLMGFALSLSSNDGFGLGFKSGTSNANRGNGLSGKERYGRKGPNGELPKHPITGEDTMPWEPVDGILNRTDQKLVLNYLSNYGLSNIKLKDELW